MPLLITLLFIILLKIRILFVLNTFHIPSLELLKIFLLKIKPALKTKKEMWYDRLPLARDLHIIRRSLSKQLSDLA